VNAHGDAQCSCSSNSYSCSRICGSCALACSGSKCRTPRRRKTTQRQRPTNIDHHTIKLFHVGQCSQCAPHHFVSRNHQCSNSRNSIQKCTDIAFNSCPEISSRPRTRRIFLHPTASASLRVRHLHLHLQLWYAHVYAAAFKIDRDVVEMTYSAAAGWMSIMIGVPAAPARAYDRLSFACRSYEVRVSAIHRWQPPRHLLHRRHNHV
jgi:hypothetical protein